MRINLDSCKNVLAKRGAWIETKHYCISVKIVILFGQGIRFSKGGKARLLAKKGETCMNLHDEIARIAYELYLKRGCVKGHDSDDWLEAERIVMSRHSVTDMPAETRTETAKPKRVRKTAAKTTEKKEPKPARTAGTKTTRKKKTE